MFVQEGLLLSFKTRNDKNQPVLK